jgi:glucose-1-phosphate thymidylyltransferase
MRGILLAGGTGTRLHPLTRAVSKQLMPVFDKPLVYYPLSTLIMAGIHEILIITTPQQRPQFEWLLGDGSQLGLSLSYAEQARPEGIAQAYLIAEDFIGDEPSALILGDNILHGIGLGRQLQDHTDVAGGHIFAYRMADPRAYGVVELDEETGRCLSIEEKPKQPRSNFAMPGLYFFDSRAAKLAGELRPSGRGELEITDLCRVYQERDELTVTVLDRGTAWLDAGSFTSLMQASEYVRVVEERQGLKIGCVEETAWRAGLIDDDQLRALAEPLLSSGYGTYLVQLLDVAGLRD